MGDDEGECSRALRFAVRCSAHFFLRLGGRQWSSVMLTDGRTLTHDDNPNRGWFDSRTGFVCVILGSDVGDGNGAPRFNVAQETGTEMPSMHQTKNMQ